MRKSEKPLWRRITNRVLQGLAHTLPGSTTLRPALHRLRGVKIGRDVFIGDKVYLENEFPELISIGDHTAISLHTVVMAHLGRADKKHGTISGRVKIGDNVFVGACSFIAASPESVLEIGDGAVLGACSVIVNRCVRAGAFVLPAETREVGIAQIPFTAAYSYQHFLSGLRPHKDREVP